MGAAAAYEVLAPAASAATLAATGTGGQGERAKIESSIAAEKAEAMAARAETGALATEEKIEATVALIEAAVAAAADKNPADSFAQSSFELTSIPAAALIAG